MSYVIRYTGLGVAAVALVALSAVGCGGDDNGGDEPRAGSPNGGSSSAGTSNGGTNSASSSNNGGSNNGGANNGGSSNAGTSNGGTGGSGGSGGSGGQMAMACPGVEPPSNAISDFTDLVGNEPNWGEAPNENAFYGGFFAYPAAAITLDFAEDTLNGGGNVADYSGIGMWLAYCADASAFEGVRFTIAGNAGPSGSVTFTLQTNQNYWANAMEMKGACLASQANRYSACVSPFIVIDDISETPQTVEILWSDLKGGKPTASTDGSDIVGLQWAFAWTEGATAYDAELTIDDVEFIGEGSGGMGNGGAGGMGSAGESSVEAGAGGMGGSG